jgi:PAS domain S-box-containing protein
MPTVLFVPGLGAVTLAALAKVVSQRRLRVQPAKAVFNVAQWSFATAVGSLVFTSLYSGERDTAEALPALLVAMVVTMAVNHAALVTVLSLVKRQRAAAVLADLRPIVVPIWIVGGAANLALGVLFSALSSWAPVITVVVIAPLALFDAAHRASAASRTDRRRMASLQRATAALAKPVDPRDAVPAFLAEVAACFDADHAALVLFDDAAVDTTLVPLAEAVVAKPGEHITAPGQRDALGVPLRRDGETLGALVVFDPSGGTGTSEGEAAVLTAMASELLSALERADLLALALDERRLLAQIFDTTSDGVCAIADDGAIVTWNRAMEQLTGYGAAEMSTVDALTVLEPTDADGQPLDLTGLDFSAASPGEIRIRNRLREPVWLACAWSHTPGFAGQPAMRVCTARDVTVARERRRLKDEFTSMVSHELMTPIAIARGFAETLLQNEDAMSRELRREALLSIQRSAQRLERVVTNVLAISQIESGRMTERSAVALGPVCRDAIAEIALSDPEHHIELDAACDDLVALGRAESISQILGNLLSNAVKYGGSGTVDIRGAHGPGVVTVSVVDHGPGIPEHEQERIFERFERLHQQDRQAGTGLGLYIARQLAEEMGGSLDVTSQAGEGCVFQLTVPAVSGVDGWVDTELRSAVGDGTEQLREHLGDLGGEIVAVGSVEVEDARSVPAVGRGAGGLAER